MVGDAEIIEPPKRLVGESVGAVVGTIDVPGIALLVGFLVDGEVVDTVGPIVAESDVGAFDT